MSPAGGQMLTGPAGLVVAYSPDLDADQVPRPPTEGGGGIPRRVITQLPDIAAPVSSEEGSIRPGVAVPMGASLPAAMSGGADVPAAVMPGSTRAFIRPANAKAAEPVVLRHEIARLPDGVVADNGVGRATGFDSAPDTGTVVVPANFASAEIAAVTPSATNGAPGVIPRPRSFSWPMAAMPEPVRTDEAPSDLLVRIEVDAPPSSVSRSSVSELKPADPLVMEDISGEILTAPEITPPVNTRAGFSTMTRDVAVPRPGTEALSPERVASATEIGEQDAICEITIEPRQASVGGAFGREVVTAEVREQDAAGEVPVGRLTAVAPKDTANSAARPRGNPSVKSDVGSGRGKNFLNGGTERLAETDPGLGTDVAKPTATMPSRFFPSDGANRKFEYVTTAPTAPTGMSPVVAPAAAKLELAPVVFAAPVSVRGAVEAVLQVTEAAQSREQKSVSLQFSVGQENLGVRVELIGGEVRATFHTDSADLHAALAHEWQAAASGTWGADRGVKLSPAVFAAVDGNAQNAFSGDAAPRERSPHSRREQAESRLARSISSVSGASHHGEPLVPAIAARLGFAGNSLHLHTLA